MQQKKYLKRINKNEFVFAQQITENKKVLLKEYEDVKEVMASEGDWIVTEENGNQRVFSNRSFELNFEPYKNLLLD